MQIADAAEVASAVFFSLDARKSGFWAPKLIWPSARENILLEGKGHQRTDGMGCDVAETAGFAGEESFFILGK